MELRTDIARRGNIIYRRAIVLGADAPNGNRLHMRAVFANGAAVLHGEQIIGGGEKRSQIRTQRLCRLLCRLGVADAAGEIASQCVIKNWIVHPLRQLHQRLFGSALAAE